jgi:hypothetical protein
MTFLIKNRQTGRRRYRDQTFRKADVVRALKAAQRAGFPNPRIEIDRRGTITIVPGGNPPQDNGTMLDDTPEQIIARL